jgi:hypothetical protein
MNQKLQREGKNLFAFQQQVAEGLWFRRTDGVMLKTTGRSAPLFYDSSWRVRVFKHEVVVFDGDYTGGSNKKTYFTNLDVHTKSQPECRCSPKSMTSIDQTCDASWPCVLHHAAPR